MKYQFWTLKAYPEGVAEVLKKMGKNAVYLSPDAEEELEEVGEDSAFVIGGLVDRTVQKNASLNRARELGIPAKRLPIQEFMIGRKCLNLDHVVTMVCKFKETKDWKTAFDFSAPKRWKKDHVPKAKRRENKK